MFANLFCVHEYICEPDCSKSKLIKLLPNCKVTYVNGQLKKIEPWCRILGRVDLWRIWYARLHPCEWRQISHDLINLIDIYENIYYIRYDMICVPASVWVAGDKWAVGASVDISRARDCFSHRLSGSADLPQVHHCLLLFQQRKTISSLQTKVISGRNQLWFKYPLYQPQFTSRTKLNYKCRWEGKNKGEGFD